jgi:hypothetical protein
VLGEWNFRSNLALIITGDIVLSECNYLITKYSGLCVLSSGAHFNTEIVGAFGILPTHRHTNAIDADSASVVRHRNTQGKLSL